MLFNFKIPQEMSSWNMSTTTSHATWINSLQINSTGTSIPFPFLSETKVDQCSVLRGREGEQQWYNYWEHWYNYWECNYMLAYIWMLSKMVLILPILAMPRNRPGFDQLLLQKKQMEKTGVKTKKWTRCQTAETHDWH